MVGLVVGAVPLVEDGLAVVEIEEVCSYSMGKFIPVKKRIFQVNSHEVVLLAV